MQQYIYSIRDNNKIAFKNMFGPGFAVSFSHLSREKKNSKEKKSKWKKGQSVSQGSLLHVLVYELSKIDCKFSS